MAGKMPTVFITIKTINHPWSLLLAARHKANPFKISSIIAAAAIATARLVLIDISFITKILPLNNVFCNHNRAKHVYTVATLAKYRRQENIYNMTAVVNIFILDGLFGLKCLG